MSTKTAKQAGIGDFITVKTKDYAGTVAISEAAAVEQVKLVGTKSAELHSLIAITGASVIMVAIEEGKVGPANAMIEALGDGFRRNSFRDWLVKFGPFRYDEKQKTMVLHKDKRASLQSTMTKTGKVKFASKIVALPFFKWKPEEKYKEFNFAQQLAALMATANKLKLGDTKGYNPEKIDLDGMDEVGKIIPMLRAKAKAAAAIEPKTEAEDPTHDEAEGEDEGDFDQAQAAA